MRLLRDMILLFKDSSDLASKARLANNPCGRAIFKYERGLVKRDSQDAQLEFSEKFGLLLHLLAINWGT